VKLALTVNGKRHEIDVPPNASLLSVLRDDLDLTGTRYGCGRGQCGACYVIADSRAVASCLLTADQAARMQITTVEGLGTVEDLSPIQQAFVHHYAAQCGFCTSGMMLAGQSYIAHGGSDDAESIQKALGGHVCRCTGYAKIVEAVAAAARGDSFDLTETAVGKYTTMTTGGAE